MGKFKSVFISVLVLAFAIMIVGCTSTTTRAGTMASSRVPGSLDFPLSDESVKSGFPESMNPSDDFVLKMEQGEYPTDLTQIAFLIENRSDRDMMTGAPYALEIFRDNAWYTVSYKKLDGNMQRAWPAIAYLISANGSWSSTISLSEHIPLTPGRYRLIKELLSQERENRNSIFVSAEFHVMQTEKKTGTITRNMPDFGEPISSDDF